MTSIQSRKKKLQLLGDSITADKNDSRNNSRVFYVQDIIHSVLFDSLDKSLFFRVHSKPTIQCRVSVILMVTHMCEVRPVLLSKACLSLRGTPLISCLSFWR